MMRVIGAFVLTYFLSRALRWLGLKPPSVTKLVAAHVLSFVILALVAIALRQPINTFAVAQLWVYVFAQGAWLLLDLYRAQVAFWKPPVTPATEPSQTKRAGSSP
jgi:hypothetical protein